MMRRGGLSPEPLTVEGLTPRPRWIGENEVYVPISLNALASIEIGLEDGLMRQSGWDPIPAGDIFDRLEDFGDMESVLPEECRAVVYATKFVTADDSGSTDPVVYVGGIEVEHGSDDAGGDMWTGVKLRVFPSAREARAFVREAADASRRCRYGYSRDAHWDRVGDVVVTSEFGLGGGKWVTIDERDVEETEQDQVFEYENRLTYLWAHENLVVMLDGVRTNRGGHSVPPSYFQLDAIYRQIGAQLRQ
jgi:hypothetical protein